MLNGRRNSPFSTFYTSTRRDSTSLPDYYRKTRFEQYGPYYRSSKSAQDLMKTIDLRGRESPDSICALPDIPEENELEPDELAFEILAKLDYRFEDDSIHDGIEVPNEHKKEAKGLRWLWRLTLSVVRKYYKRWAVSEKTQ